MLETDTRKIGLESFIRHAKLILDSILYLEHETGLFFFEGRTMFEKNAAHMVESNARFLQPSSVKSTRGGDLECSIRFANLILD